jgi:hypothetical protein
MRRQHVATGVSLWLNAIKNEAAIAAAEMGKRFQSKVETRSQREEFQVDYFNYSFFRHCSKFEINSERLL